MGYSIYSDYNNVVNNNAIAIVPVKGFNISEKYSINSINIYPQGTLDEDEIKGWHLDFSFKEIKKYFYDSTLITFPMEYERKNLMGVLLPSEKYKLINTVSERAEDVMNVLRYINSNFDKLSNLPQRAGYISGLKSGFLIYYPYMKMSDYVADKYHVLNITIGNGLSIDIDEAIASGARQYKACAELNIHERTYTRWKNPTTPLEDQRPLTIRPEPHNKIAPEVHQEIMTVSNSDHYKGLSPHQIVPKLLDEEERYIASESTMYRVLRETDMIHQKSPERRKASMHKATDPNQVWMWDITWLPGAVKGFYFYLYLILDLYSQKIVGWEIWPEESSENASVLVKKTVLSEGCSMRSEPLVLH